MRDDSGDLERRSRGARAMDIHRGGWIERGAVRRARSARRRAAHRLRPRRTHQLDDRAARVRGRASQRTTSSFSGCAATPRRSSCSSSSSIRAAPTSGGGGGRASRPAARPRALVLRKASLEFAWGPASGGEPERIGAVELALAADRARSGTIWIEELRDRAARSRGDAAAVRRRRGVELAARPRARVRARRERRHQLEPGPRRCAVLDRARSRPPCECGGVVVDFAGSAGVPRRRLLASDDAVQLEASRRRPRRPGRRGGCARPTEKGASRASNSRPARPRRWRASAVVPLELAVSPARYVTAIAASARRAAATRAICSASRPTGPSSAPTATSTRACSSEDGALEVDAESFSIEPFLWTDGRLVTWADVERHVSARRWPPADSDRRVGGRRICALRITAFAAGAPGASTLVAPLRRRERERAPRAVRLFVAIRPFQVNPAWQSLNLVGGVAPRDARSSAAATRPSERRRGPCSS